MIEQTLMKFEEEHSDLMCGYDEYKSYWSLETEKSKTHIGKWSIGELLCKALPFHDEIELCIIQAIKKVPGIPGTIFYRIDLRFYPYKEYCRLYRDDLYKDKESLQNKQLWQVQLLLPME